MTSHRRFLLPFRAVPLALSAPGSRTAVAQAAAAVGNGLSAAAVARGRAVYWKPRTHWTPSRETLLAWQPSTCADSISAGSAYSPPARGDPEEHPGLSSDILKRISAFSEIAGNHHEELDGSGYPSKLQASDLSLEARILTIADIYGALNRRPFLSSRIFPRQDRIQHGQRDSAQSRPRLL